MLYSTLKIYFRHKQLERKLKKSNTFYTPIDNPNHYEKYVLIIDDKIPEFDKDSGSRRLTEIIKLLLKNKVGVFLMADLKEYRYKTDYVAFFRKLGVDVYEPSLNQKSKLVTRDEFLKLNLPKVGFVWLHRPEIFKKYAPIVKMYNPNVKLFFDMVDFHYLRFKREATFSDNNETLKTAEKYLKLELENCSLADKTIVISELDKIALKPYFDDDSKTIAIGNIHQFINNKELPNYSQRKDLIFIGGFDHKPNVDCVNYLHSEIMPIIWKTHPEISISIIGSKVPEVIKALDKPNFRIIGYVAHLDSYFNVARIFVAPLQYGAGIKGKIGQSLEYSLPLVTTDIGAEGFDFFENKELMIANTTEEIAQKIITIYKDEAVWNKISKNSYKVIEPFSLESIEKKIVSLFN
jgi:O-antigen biosynthesis protein